MATVPSSSTLPSTSFTVAAWIKFDSIGTAVSWGEDPSSDQYVWFLGVSNASGHDGHLVAGLENGATQANFWGTTPQLDDSAWHHVAMTRTPGGTFTLYVDGAADAVFTTSLTPAWQPSDLCVGGAVNNSGSSTQVFSVPAGLIDELSIWDFALDANQINALMTAPPEAASFGLVAAWNFTEGQGTVASDVSGNGHDMLLGVPATGATCGGGCIAPLWVFGQDCPPHLPGTGDDFALGARVNGLGLSGGLGPASGGDLLTLAIVASGSSFSGLPMALILELRAAGSPYPTPFAPDLWFSTDATVLFDGFQPGSFGSNFVVVPGGTTLGFVVPVGLTGFNALFQAVLLSPAATNGLYASTNAVDVAGI